MEKCEKCGKNKKRYRVAFGSWICDACHIETHRDTPHHAVEVIRANGWWAELTNDSKLLVWQEFVKNKPPLKRWRDLCREPDT